VRPNRPLDFIFSFKFVNNQGFIGLSLSQKPSIAQYDILYILHSSLTNANDLSS